jgi:hypothetical protein
MAELKQWQPDEALAEVSLVTANFGNGLVFREILLDWFAFLGGRPGEVVVVDGGSDEATQAVYWDLYREGHIDKLQVIRPEHPDNSRFTCFIQEHTVAAIASKPYVLFFKIDTLPFRRGHDDWLAESLAHLEREEVFAVGGSFNNPSKHHEAWPGWYFSDKCSENFALMKRETFMNAMEEFAGRYLTSGFRGENPAAGIGQERYLIEVAFERYIERHGVYTLVRTEDESWTVFHTNVREERLVKVREDYRRRKHVTRYMNAGAAETVARYRYYGIPGPGLIKELRVRFGASRFGPCWRAIRRRCGLGRVTS